MRPIQSPKEPIAPPAHELYYKGLSMRGVFRTGDKLLLHSCAIAALRPGDIIVFGHNGSDIVHRVVEHHGLFVKTWGDFNPYPDRVEITPDMIKGRVHAFQRQGRRVHRVKAGPQGGRIWTWHQRQLRFLLLLNGILNRRFAPGSLSWIFSIEPIRLRVENPNRLILVYRNRNIGHLDSTAGRFHLKKPWSLFFSRRFVASTLTGEPSPPDTP